MRFLWCVVLATLAFSQDLKLDLSLEEDTSPSSSTQKQDDDFLNSLELELNQAAKESKPQEEDEEGIEIPKPNNPDTPPKEPTQEPLMQQEAPKQETPQPQNNSATLNTDSQSTTPQSVIPQEEGELIIPTDPSTTPQESSNQQSLESTPQPSQEPQAQPNTQSPQPQEEIVGQDSNTTPQIQENQEQQIPQDNSQNIEQTPAPQSLEQSNIQTQEPIPQSQPIQQPQTTQQAPQIQQTPQPSQALQVPQAQNTQPNTAQPSQTPPTPQPQNPQAPLTSQPLQNTTPLPTKDEHLTYREKIKIISREELLKKSNRCDEKGEEKVCFDVGMIYYQGRSEKGQDLQEAYHYLEKSCKGKKGLGCYEAGIIRANSGVDLPYGAALLNRACELGDLRGCRNLAILYYNGQGVPKNIYQAFNLFKKGCEAGDQKSCLKFYLGLGNTYRDTQNYPKAKIMYEKACKLGEQAACNELYLLSRKAHPSTRYLFGNSQNKP